MTVNRKNTFSETNEEFNKSGEYAVHRNRWMDAVVLLVCLLLALLVWIVVMQTENTDKAELYVMAPQDGLTYTLSIDSVEIEGKIVDLKAVERIGVRVPGHTAGVYTLTEQDLDLPEGVQLTAPLTLTLSVRPQS